MLATASTMCNACEEVCPVKIPIPDLLRRMRDESYAGDATGTMDGYGYKRNWTEMMLWKAWAVMNTHPLINAAGQKVMSAMRLRLPKVGPLKNWTLHRTAPQPAKKSLHDLVKEHGVDNE